MQYSSYILSFSSSKNVPPNGTIGPATSPGLARPADLLMLPLGRCAPGFAARNSCWGETGFSGSVQFPFPYSFCVFASAHPYFWGAIIPGLQSAISCLYFPTPLSRLESARPKLSAYYIEEVAAEMWAPNHQLTSVQVDWRLLM